MEEINCMGSHYFNNIEDACGIGLVLYIPGKTVYRSRKSAMNEMGEENYKKALRNREMLFINCRADAMLMNAVLGMPLTNEELFTKNDEEELK